ncbi:hypothetical protein G6F32_012565 [Rhizopus arrhizus]|nr:hypothetical protein G6F32_012565 [Rhizopus arrhizus]
MNLKYTNNNVANLESQTVFLQAIDKHSIVIAASEFEGLNFKDRSLNLVLRDQFPKGIGLRERKIGRTHQYIELNFDNEEDKMDALKKEFLILDRKIKVQTTMDKNLEVIRIGITNIPYEKDDKLKPLMIQLFEKYESILEIGLHHTVDGGWFNGRGYVTLVKDKAKNYEPLTPQIPSWEQANVLMPLGISQTSNQASITEFVNLCQEMLDNAVAAKKNAKRKVMTLECDPQDAIERLRQYDNIMLESKTFSVGYLVKKSGH